MKPLLFISIIAVTTLLVAVTVAHEWSFGQAKQDNPFDYDQDAQHPFAWRQYDSHYYNLGRTISKRHCANGNNTRCSKLFTVHRAPSRYLVSQASFLVVYNRVHDQYGTAGPFGLHSLVNMINKIGGSAFMYRVSPIWDNFGRKVPEWSPSTVDQFMQKYYDNAIVIVPDGSEDVIPDGPTRVVRWMLGWHDHVRRNYRIIAHTHHLQKVAGGSTPLLWNHGPPTYFLDSYKKHVDYKQKENLILLDYDSHISAKQIEDELKATIPDVKVLDFAGFTPEQVKKLYTRAKIVVDHDMPGAEMINVEGLLFGTLPVMGNNLVGGATVDYQALPAKLRIDPHHPKELVKTLADALLNYDKYTNIVEILRNDVIDMDTRYERDVSISLMGQGLLFYTAVSSNDDMRAVIPWLLSVAAAFPLARAEVIVPTLDVYERELEAALLVVRALNKGVLGRQYVTIRPAGVHTVGSGNPFLVPPISTGHVYTVFMDVNTLLLGRDFVNMHDNIIRRRNLVGIGDPSSSPIVMVKSDLYWRALDRIGEVLKHGHEGAQRAMDPQLRDYINDHFRTFQNARPALEAMLKFSNLPTIVVDDCLHGLPLDTLTVGYGLRSGKYRLHLTHKWAVDLNVHEEFVPSVIEALDPLVHSPVWAAASPFFPTHYQWLSYPRVGLHEQSSWGDY